jgi:zinc finger protein
MVIAESEPVRYVFPVQEPSDLNARVVRSTTGIIKIPEFGVNIEPGPICEGFISNVEGVLDRVERAVNMALTWSNGDELENAINLQATIQEARKGKVPFTLIIQDQDGNSAIIHPNAVKEPYSDEDDPKQDDEDLKDKS